MEGVVTDLVAKCDVRSSMCCVRHGVRHLVHQTHDQKTNRRYSRMCSKAQKITKQSGHYILMSRTWLSKERGEGYSNSHGPRCRRHDGGRRISIVTLLRFHISSGRTPLARL